MPATFTLISSVTVGSGGAANIEFTSIPNTYTDLLVKTSLRCSGSGTPEFSTISLNNSSANFTFRYLQGNGSNTSSGAYSSAPNETIPSTSFTSNTFANSDWYFPNYAGSNNKSFSIDNVTENNATTSYANLFACLWTNTSAITSIKFVPSNGSYVQYTTAYLYGISNA